jgi:hypothetical protein
MRRVIFVPSGNQAEIQAANTMFPGDSVIVIEVSGMLTPSFLVDAVRRRPGAHGMDVLMVLGLPVDGILAHIEQWRDINQFLSPTGTLLEFVRSNARATRAQVRRVIRHFCPRVSDVNFVDVEAEGRH